MIDKRVFFTGLIGVALLLGVACTQAAAPTPTPPGEQTGTTPLPGGPMTITVGGSSVTRILPEFGAGTVESAGFTVFAAPQYANGTQASGVWVGGSGLVVVVPDLALLSMGVEARATTVAEARSDAAIAMSAIMDVLTGSGIEEKDIRTQFFNIQTEYTWNDIERKQELTGYRVTNSITVKVRDLENVGTLVDQVSEAGGDLARINSISFTTENPAQYAAQARQAAVEDALAKAQQFATLTGVTLGKLLYIAETGGNIPVARQAFDTGVSFESAALAPPTPISQGEMNITISVQAVFEIL